MTFIVTGLIVKTTLYVEVEKFGFIFQSK